VCELRVRDTGNASAEQPASHKIRIINPNLAHALYRAKAKGRNRVESVEQEPPLTLTRKFTIVRAGGDTVAWHVDARTAPGA